MKNKSLIISATVLLFLVILITFLVISSNTENVVVLGKYTDLSLDTVKTIVTDEEVEAAMLENIASMIEPVEVTNRPVEEGDTANIDFLGKIDGIPFEGGEGEDFDLEIGSGSFIEGFEEQVIGMKLNETKDLNVTFPDSYQVEELSNKDAVFTVTVNKILKKEVPTKITDKVVEEVSDTYKTVAEFRKYTRELLEEQAAENDKYNTSEALWSLIIGDTRVESLSNKKVNYYKNYLQRNYKAYADMYQITLDEFIQTYLGMSKDEYNVEKQEFGKSNATKYAISEAIAKEENISVSNEEYNSHIEEQGYSAEDEKIFRENIKDELLYKKVLEFVTDKANITVN